MHILERLPLATPHFDEELPLDLLRSVVPHAKQMNDIMTGQHKTRNWSLGAIDEPVHGAPPPSTAAVVLARLRFIAAARSLADLKSGSNRPSTTDAGLFSTTTAVTEQAACGERHSSSRQGHAAGSTMMSPLTALKPNDLRTATTGQPSLPSQARLADGAVNTLYKVTKTIYLQPEPSVMLYICIDVTHICNDMSILHVPHNHKLCSRKMSF